MTDTLESNSPDDRSPMHRLASTLADDASGVVGLLVLMGTAVVGSYVLWPLFAQPLAIIADVLPTKTCTNEVEGTTAMRLCGTGAGLVRMIGPMALGLGIVVARKPLTRWTQTLAQKLPVGLRQLVAPLLAVAMFLLIWAGTHKDTSELAGLLPQKAFPVLIGAYTYAVMQYGEALQARMPGFFDARDKLPFAVRLTITLSIPTLISVIITNQNRVTATALKEQVVVVIGLVLAYLFLVPRGENISAVTNRLLGEQPS